MRILVAGAYGLIGSYVVARLLAEGHTVIGVGREVAASRRRLPEVTWMQADLGTASVESWVAVLQGTDAVVNCAGALQDSPRDDLQAVHVEGVRGLATACRRAGVTRFIHLSAAGVAEGRATGFNRTKWLAEGVLKESDLDWIILRPGFVWAPSAYGGSALLRGLAGFPGVLPIVHADSVIQVVAVEDVASAVVSALEPGAPVRISVDLVHDEAVTLERLVLALRRWLGLPEARVLRLPAGLARLTARLADALAYLGWRSPMRTAAIEQLRMGIRGDASCLPGVALNSLGQMLARRPAGVQERWFARLYFLKPAILGMLCFYWFLSGIIGLVFSRAEAVSMLTVVGVSPLLAQGAVVSGSVIDIGLALAVAFRRSARWALQGMLLVSAGYLLAGTCLRPDLWLDPLSPLLKILPAGFLACCALAMLDER
jgi:uncharacterized protein YbjT (DUF2867 family)